MELGNKLSIFICKYFFDGFEGRRVCEFDGFSEEVYLFSDRYTMGLTTEWGDVLLNRQLFDCYESLQRYFFLHEIGHREHPVLRIIGGISQLLLYPLLVAALLSGLIGVQDIGFLAVDSRKAIALSFLLFSGFLIAFLFSYISELGAELFALQRLGKEDYLEVKMRNSKRAKETLGVVRFLVWRNGNLVTMPSTRLVLLINDIRNAL